LTKHGVERKVVGTHYDARGLAGDPVYRALFYDELKDNLERDGDTIVQAWLTEAALSSPKGVRPNKAAARFRYSSDFFNLFVWVS
jgi:hypothetical protein